MLRKSAKNNHCNIGTTTACSSLILTVCVCLLSLFQPAQAAITWSGDIDPDDPTEWTSSTCCYVGKTGTGSLQVNDDSDLNSYWSYIGYEPGSTGEVTVDGGGTTWNSSSNYFYVGCEGNGTLSITGGAAVSNSYDGYIGYYPSSIGDVTVEGAGSTWTLNRALTIGNHGNGTLNITDGAVVNSNTTTSYVYNSTIGNESGSSGTVLIDGADSEWTDSSKSLQIGYYGSGVLSITQGATVSNGSACIGNNSGSTGEVTVSGSGSTWNNVGELGVGRNGKGNLNIIDGAIVSCASVGIGVVIIDGNIDSCSMMTLDGADSTLNIGSASNPGTAGMGLAIGGIMSVTGGAVCNSYSYRNGVYSYGSVTVDGAGSYINNTGDLYVNSTNENGAIIITNGGIVDNSNAYISYTQYHDPFVPIPTCKVIVDGDGSSWNNSENIYIGCDANGSLSITRGAIVSSDTGYVGIEPDGIYSPCTGMVTVDGAGSTWANSSDLNIGNGTLSIKNAASVSCKYGRIGSTSTSTAEVTVDGEGSTCASDVIFVGWKGNGTLSITGGASVSDSIDAAIGCLSGATGEVTVDGTGSTWTNKGLFVGYNGSGALDITDGGFVSVAETLTIDRNGDGDGFINMTTGGMLALFGDADNSLDDFLDLIEGTDAIRYWDDSISDWADITGATSGRDYTLSYLNEGDLDGYTMLTVERAIEGDANHDGVVNDDDAAVMTTYWLTASGATWEMGDFNDDGAVDEIDATLLAANWHGGVDEQGVPEPTVLVGLLGLALAGMLRVGRVRER